MKTLRTSALTCFAFLATALTAFAGDPNGTWKFTAEGPNGRATESTLTLKWENNQLSGTIDNRAGKAEIKNATFQNDQVSFTVHREFGRRLRKVKLDVRYAGQLEGDTIKGTIETTGRDKQPVSLPWEAQRVK